MERPKTTCHVISNTHWDREWRYPFQSYRMDLVDMMDRLLTILDTVPDYRAFFLDSQTVILEDYLEIRPGNEERVRGHVQAGRLQIGPWYTLPDMWGCPGEALVRNLLMGHRTARHFGGVTKVGYTPFSNGQISQLPQLYQGFGIDSCFFYRGIGKHVAKSDFIWEAPDGSRIFGFRFGDYARYNYYYLLYRPGLLGRTTKDREYIWNPDEVPYHVAVEQSQDRQYGWISQELHVHEDKLAQALEDGRRYTAADAQTPQLLYMMGHDHSFGAKEELELIRALQARTDPEKESVIHSALTDYMEAFRTEAKDLQVLRGEMRHTLKEGLWTTLMALILSCRLYLKQRNARVNAQVLYGAEPLASLAWVTGSPYPAPFLEIAWKKLLINQAHDDIGGCSVDRVHEEMMARWGEVETISDEVCRRSMRDVAARLDGSWLDRSDLQLTVFNTLPWKRSCISEFIIDLPSAGASTGLSVERRDGTPVPVQVLSQESYTPTIEGGYELNMPFHVQRFRAKLQLEELPALGCEALRVKAKPHQQQPTGAIVRSDRELENEHLCVSINANGTLRLTDKATGWVFDRQGCFEDTAEFGDPWSRAVPEGDKPLLSLRCKAKTSVTTDGELEGALKVMYAMKIPVGRGADGNRAKETVELPVTLHVSLRKNSPVVDLTVHIENRARNHRLRLLFPTGISRAKRSYAEGQFDVLSRDIRLPDSTGWKEAPYPTQPMWNFAGVSDGEQGFAVINDGLTEYEVIDDRKRAIAVTLLRTFGTFTFDRPTPGSQCLGEHVYRFRLYPHKGSWSDSDIFRLTADHLCPVQAVESAPTRGSMPHRWELLRIGNSDMVFSAVKQGEDAGQLVLRLWNPHETRQEVVIETGKPVAGAQLLSLEEIPVEELACEGGNRIRLTADPRKIVTVGIRFQ